MNISIYKSSLSLKETLKPVHSSHWEHDEAKLLRVNQGTSAPSIQAFLGSGVATEDKKTVVVQNLGEDALNPPPTILTPCVT